MKKSANAYNSGSTVKGQTVDPARLVKSHNMYWYLYIEFKSIFITMFKNFRTNDERGI